MPRIARLSIWARLNDKSVRAVLYQLIAVAIVVLAAFYLVQNTLANLETRHIKTGFDFLDLESGFAISDSLISYTPSDSYARALLVGFLNTVLVSLTGIALATILGVLIGVGRLSSNWLIARLAAIYVTVLRNVPVLLQIILWHTILTNSLPHPRQSLSLMGGVFINQRGIYFPVPETAPGWWAALLAVPAAIVIAMALARWAKRRQAKTGRITPVFWLNAAIIIALPVLAWAVMGAPAHFDLPALRGFNFRGGSKISPEFLAVLFGLTFYTTAFIAEIVRSGILAVSHGQTEAGRSLGLSEGVIMRKIILPQALRVIVPPTTNQYLNLLKNSSLAVAVGYPDLVSVANTTLNQTGQAIEAISIMMLVYLTTSLSTSLFMNWYNKRIQLVER